MKSSITHFLYMATLVLLTACSQDDETSTDIPPQDNGKPLTFTITDGGFSTGSNNGTRAVEEDNKTNFTAGDACGLYIVRNGKVRSANVKLTATQNGNNIVWTMNETVKGETTDSYYLYYPYQESMMDKVSASAGADDKAFFENLISGWEVKPDQSDYKNYTASDLMTAKGEPTESDGTIALTFSTVHRMALAVIEMPKTTYHFTNTSPAISDYVVPTSNPKDLTVTFSGDTNPWQVEKDVHIYRYIINPDKAPAITGSYNPDREGGKDTSKNHNFTITSDRLRAISAGKGKKFKIDGGIREISYLLQVGDYLCKDGTLISKETTLTNDQKKTVVALVFYAGHNGYDKTEYDGTPIQQKECHGYAVALKDAQNDKGTITTFTWGNTGVIGCYVDGNQENPEKDWNGYKYTSSIAFYYFTGNLESSCPATYYATAVYGSKVPSPVTCTSWFLPSIGQLKTICVNRNDIFGEFGGSKMANIGGSHMQFSQLYWSSSEHYKSPSDVALTFSSAGSNTAIVYNGGKNLAKCYARSILAF